MSTCRSPACCKFCRPCTTSPQPTAVAMAHMLISKRQPTGISAQLIWDTPWLLGFFVFLIYIIYLSILYYILYYLLYYIYICLVEKLLSGNPSRFFLPNSIVCKDPCHWGSVQLGLFVLGTMAANGQAMPGDARRCQQSKAFLNQCPLLIVELQCCVRDFRFCG